MRLPFRKPPAGEPDVTSGFGIRLDPFLRRPAMHIGVDFRGDEGGPVHATAAVTNRDGAVVTAVWSKSTTAARRLFDS